MKKNEKPLVELYEGAMALLLKDKEVKELCQRNFTKGDKKCQLKK